MSVLVCPLYQVSPQFLAVKKSIQQRLADLGHYSEPVKDSFESYSWFALSASFEAIKLAVLLFSEKFRVLLCRSEGNLADIIRIYSKSTYDNFRISECSTPTRVLDPCKIWVSVLRFLTTLQSFLKARMRHYPSSMSPNPSVCKSLCSICMSFWSINSASS